ncbi:hypothetical protein [Streptomyces sp. NPDC050355]|uniref:hypothetical protein n=1 Tax=Streptomyces sp. NPDC050355 TaxID=3365609 RepID=UPI0037AA5ED1
MPDDAQHLVPGGHLVAEALKAERVDRVYTLCGGHLIDIYDDCVDEGGTAPPPRLTPIPTSPLPHPYPCVRSTIAR